MSITAPLKRHAGISAVFAVIGIVIGITVAYSIGAYTIPEAWGVAVANNDLVTFAGVICVAAVVILWIMAPGLLAGKDAHDKYGEALEYDKHTEDDDKTPYGSYTVKDDGLYKGSRKVRNLSQCELDERKALSDGGLSGYNAEINRVIDEGRR